MKKKTGKDIKAAPRKTRLSLINFKVSAGDRAAIASAASRFAGGNLSAWLRFAAMNFNKPIKKVSSFM